MGGCISTENIQKRNNEQKYNRSQNFYKSKKPVSSTTEQQAAYNTHDNLPTTYVGSFAMISTMSSYDSGGGCSSYDGGGYDGGGCDGGGGDGD